MATVIKAFIDKSTQAPYNVGYEFSGTESRIKELLAGGYLERAAESEPKKAKKASKKPADK